MNAEFQFDTTTAAPVKLEEFINLIDYRVVRSKEELENAYSLVYKEYLKRNYIKENPSCLKLSIYNALPQTATFVAAANKEILATATMVPDSPLGLPMDEIYHEELRQLREKNARLCEITMLASNTELFKNGVSMMLSSKKLFFILYLFKLIYDYARYITKMDYLCITINPKHKLVYDFLLFQELGKLKTYNSANGAPAIAEYLDLFAAEEHCKKANDKEGLSKMFFTRQTPSEKFSLKFVFGFQDLRYFFSEKTDIFKITPPDKLKYIENCYPYYDFSKIIQ